MKNNVNISDDLRQHWEGFLDPPSGPVSHRWRNTALAGVSNLQAAGHMCAKTPMNVAQHKSVNWLKTIILLFKKTLWYNDMVLKY